MRISSGSKSTRPPAVWLLLVAVLAVAVAAGLLFVLLPAFGLTYAVAVNRVLAPRVVIRRSLQYALARGTLTAFAVLPALALAISLIRQRDMTISMIVSGAPAFYLVMIAASVAALKYRDRRHRRARLLEAQRLPARARARTARPAAPEPR